VQGAGCSGRAGDRHHPDPDNHQARQAYRKAGFVGEEVVETPEGPAVPMLYKG